MVAELIDKKPCIDKSILDNAPYEQLNNLCDDLLINYNCADSQVTNENLNIIDDTLSNIKRCETTGRLIVPALWKQEVQHMLSHNFNLSRSILKSHGKKLSPAKLYEYDNVIKEQANTGVIEEVDLKSEKNNPNVSFLPHSAVFRQTSTSTKCRVVFLSNLKEGHNSSLSHNQISKPGLNLNHKLLIALTLLRFDPYLVTFDLKKAFLQLLLSDEDTMKLRFLWFRDVSKGDFSIVSYRICRVPFGMRFSPFLLMISLYYILMRRASDNSDCQNVKKAIYDLAYVDNLAYSADSPEELIEAIQIARSTFEQYGFSLQQFCSNSLTVNDHVSREFDEQMNDDVKLLGVMWDTQGDILKTRKLYLNPNVKTKRSILSTIQSNFDPFGLNIPLLNRARLFMHQLQCDSTLSWDTMLDVAKSREWLNIARQINKSAELTVPRAVGPRTGVYSLLVYCDASKHFIGCCVYLYNNVSKSMSLILSRNSIVAGNLRTKSIPVLELTALHFGAETAMDVYQNLTGAVRPIAISDLYLFTDSIISLCWIKSKEILYGKIDRKNVYINNRLNDISSLCQKKAIKFDHISGGNNPADCLTRQFSDRQLMSTRYLSGPEFKGMPTEYAVCVPNPLTEEPMQSILTSVASHSCNSVPLIDLTRFSSFDKYVICMTYVFKFITMKCQPNLCINLASLKIKAANYVLREAQKSAFPITYQSLSDRLCNDPLTEQLNLFLDDNGVIRLLSKLKRLKASYGEKCPILLDKNCPVARSIIWGTHINAGHAGLYKILSLLRKEFWITNGFVTVKKVLRQCVKCRRVNNRTVKINQNAYRDFRVNPESIPFRNVCMDHCGPFTIKSEDGSNVKVYILVISCFWSRAVNLLVCRNINKDSFLRAFQLHIFDHGIPSVVVSDNGSPIVAGVNQTISYLSDDDSRQFLASRNIQMLKFHPYPAGASKLGGFIESLVKQVKKIMYTSVGRNILDYLDFEFLVREARMLINKRPIAFSNSLNKLDPELSISVLTPEIIMNGREIPCFSILPQLHSESVDTDFILEDRQKVIIDRYKKLCKVRRKLEDLYQSEFVSNLMHLATDRKARYKQYSHTELKLGDLVSVRSDGLKPYNFHLGIITAIEKNDIGEVVAASLRKSNGEVIRRHSSDLILLLNAQLEDSLESKSDCLDVIEPNVKIKRKAAVKCDVLNKKLLANNYV